ncbi:MAG: sensor histidine kinase [Planctomycetota bacterium]
MSLAWRILLVVLLLNLVVVGGVQTAVFALQQQWIERQQGENLAAALVTYLLDVYTAERLDDDTQARALVQSPVIREYFDDVVVTSGGPTLAGAVWFNPRGAVQRDPDRFSMDDVLAGMNRARKEGGLVQAAGGYSTVVRDSERDVGYLWFKPKLDVAPPSLPLWFVPTTVLGGALLFGVVLYWLVVRSIGRPLQRVGAAAERVGQGAYEVRLPPLRGAPELDALVRSFNAMAGKVQDNTRDLEDAVRKAVDEAKRTERALVQSSRLATVGTLAAGIAHEINNPIGGMQNAVHRLLADPALSDRQRTYLNLVQDGLARVARTARKVLDFSPKQAQARPFSLRRCVDGARALCEHRLQLAGTALRVELPADLPQVFGDEHEIQQVVLNLFLNSLDALEQQGRPGAITVTGSPVQAGPERRVQLVVEDDGPGMDPKDLARVMDPFFTQKERPDASGLGMFISFSIVQNHGGSMTVDSAPGRGFKTVLTLPRA